MSATSATPARRPLRILNLGAGVQSTTVYLLITAGELPPIDAAIFADTQEEPDAVYRHLAWLQSRGGPSILIGTVGKLGDDLVNGRNSTGQRFATIPAFTTTDGGKTHGITRRQCSREYKTDVIGQTIRRRVVGLRPRQPLPRSIALEQLFGFSLDEGGRAARMTARFRKERPRETASFPLIDRGWTRADCLTWLASRVPHETPRSACVFCPYHSDAEWTRIKAEPREWARACAVDAALRTPGSVINRDHRQTLYLHRSCRPLADVELHPTARDAQMPLGFVGECDGVCGV